MKSVLNKIKLPLALIFVVIVVILLAGKAQAQSSLCERVGSRIDWHISRYTDHQESFIQRVNLAIDKLKAINQKLKTRGCDTSQLEIDYQQLTDLLRVWTNDYQTFINLLNEAKTLACGESEGAYHEKVKEARIQIKTVRQKAVEIINFYQGTIKPDAEALKTACFPTKD